MIFCQKKESCRQGLPRPKNKILPTISPKKSAKVKIFPVTDFLPKNYCVSGAEKQVRKHEDRYNRTAKISLDS